jgi:hypothetical protein
MFYFRIVASTICYSGQDMDPTEWLAHLFVDDTSVDSAALRAVKTLHADGWRITRVLNAHAIARGEVFPDDKSLTKAVRTAEDTGFSFLIERSFDAQTESPSLPVQTFEVTAEQRSA